MVQGQERVSKCLPSRMRGRALICKLEDVPRFMRASARACQHMRTSFSAAWVYLCCCQPTCGVPLEQPRNEVVRRWRKPRVRGDRSGRSCSDGPAPLPVVGPIEWRLAYDTR